MSEVQPFRESSRQGSSFFRKSSKPKTETKNVSFANEKENKHNKENKQNMKEHGKKWRRCAWKNEWICLDFPFLQKWKTKRAKEWMKEKMQEGKQNWIQACYNASGKPLRQSQRKRVSRKMHKTSGSIAFDDFIAVISDFSFSFSLWFLSESRFGLATHQLRIGDANLARLRLPDQSLNLHVSWPLAVSGMPPWHVMMICPLTWNINSIQFNSIHMYEGTMLFLSSIIWMIKQYKTYQQSVSNVHLISPISTPHPLGSANQAVPE